MSSEAVFSFSYPLTRLGNSNNYRVAQNNQTANGTPGTFVVVDGMDPLVEGEIITVNSANRIFWGRSNSIAPNEPGGDLIVLNPDNTYTLYSNSPTLPGGNFMRNPDSVPLCLLAGTLIRTPSASGGVPVESLSIGDKVVTADGISAIKFIGKCTRDLRVLKATGKMPVHIKANAFGSAVPEEDIYSTPTHAVYIDGCLVEAQALINGNTVQQLDDWPENTVTYYSIELQRHELIWANGLLTETYFANTRGIGFTREVWDNFLEYEALYGPGEIMQELCFPRISFRRQLPGELRERCGLPRSDAHDLLPLS